MYPETNKWADFPRSVSNTSFRKDAIEASHSKTSKFFALRMSQLIAFDRIKHIGHSIKDTVVGYIHRCQSLLPENEAYYQIPELISSIILLFYYNRIESSILTDKESDKLLSLFVEREVFQHLDNYDHEYKLIYSSKEHGDGEKIFKELCHDQPNLLCIIHDTKDNVFGGYTCSGWIGNEDYKTQRDEKAFVFGIRSDRNYEPAVFKVKDEYKGPTLWTQHGYYLMFGGENRDVFYVNMDGKSGYTDSSPPDFEPYPHAYYLTKYPFDIDFIEVFQLSD